MPRGNTPEQRRAKNILGEKWDKENTRQVKFKFNIRTDADIIAHLEAQQNKDQADALQSEVDRLKKEGSLIEDEHKQLQETLATVQAERDKLRQQLAEKANHHWWEFWK